MANKTKKTPTSLTDRLDDIIEKIYELSCDVSGGDLSPNQTYDKLEDISEEIENMRDCL